MHAFREGDTVRISDNFVEAMAGIKRGYRVHLHSLPKYVFEVSADSGDEAIKLCVVLCRKERQVLSTDAATFQRID